MANDQSWCIVTHSGMAKDLGKGYWRGFVKRNGLNVKTKRGVKFDSKWAD